MWDDICNRCHNFWCQNNIVRAILQGDDDYDMWYAIKKHKGFVYNVVESKQGHGQ